MLEGKDYCVLDMLFPFVVKFIDCATDFTEEAPTTKFLTMYSDLTRCLAYYRIDGEVTVPI